MQQHHVRRAARSRFPVEQSPCLDGGVTVGRLSPALPLPARAVGCRSLEAWPSRRYGWIVLPPNRKRIVIAEDAAVIRAGLAEILADSGHEVGAAVSDAEALKAAVAEHRRRRLPAGSPAPSGTSTAASWPDATNNPGRPCAGGIWAGARATPAYRGTAMQSLTILEDPMTVEWDDVTRAEVLRAIQEYDRLGPEEFFSEHGFAPTTTYDLVWDERRYPPKAILGTAYEFATGQRLGSRDFEGGKTGAVRVLQQLGFTVQEKRRPAR